MPGDDEANEEVRYACEEARETLDQQIEKIHREDQKAVKMARVNLLVLGILVGSFSFIFGGGNLTPSEFLSSHTAIGTLLLVASTVLAGMAYSSSHIELGGGPEIISGASGTSAESFYEALQSKYSDWLEENQAVHKMNAYAIQWVIVLAIVGVLFLVGGFVVGFTETQGSSWSYGLLTAEMLGALVVGGLISRSDVIFRILNEDQ